MNSLPVRATTTFGRPAFGHGMTITMTITGCQEPGFSRPDQAFSGRPATGPGVAAVLCSLRAIGDRSSDSTAVSIMATAISVAVMKEAVGIAATFTTTAK